MSSEKEVKRLSKIVDQVEEYAKLMSGLSDMGLRAKTDEFRDKIKNGATLDDILPEAFAVVREASKRITGMYPYRVQLMGGIVLHQGRIAEMKTGEGKTLVAVLPSYLNALTGKAVHVVTVNDYLASRDANDMGKIHEFLGLTVGVITHDTPLEDRKEIYKCDVVYGTNNEFGFDYLRDNMMKSSAAMVQRDLSFAIIDEVDSILIDEARTPLIISGGGDKSTEIFYKADELASKMKMEKFKEIDSKADTDDLECDYMVDEKNHSVIITASGYKKIEEFFDIDNSSDPENAEIIHRVTQALRAHGQMQKDKDYIVEKGKIIIVDEFTGRLMYGRQYSNGLHQAIEAKEHLDIQNETQTLATITLQNYFRMYNKISGMTGTAKTEEEEFNTIYKLDVVEIPTNKPMIRVDHDDKVYLTTKEKYDAILKQVQDCNAKGQPILIGTVSVEKSEILSDILKKNGIVHNVLNAKNHKKEAAIVANAGKFGAVTIATNMAGRGTDIILGGNPEYIAWSEHVVPKIRDILADDSIEKSEEFVNMLTHLGIYELANYRGYNETVIELQKLYNSILPEIKKECDDRHNRVVEAGGLFILGTERHESRRIDNQLRGRSGRQGDPGESCFFLSLEDELLRIFGGDKVKAIASMGRIMKGEPLQMKMLSNIIENAQKNLEGINYQTRKTVIQFDDVINQQREIIYKQRREVINGENVHEIIIKMMQSYIDENIGDNIMESIEEDHVLNAVFESDYFSQGAENPRDDFKKAIVEYYNHKMADTPEGILPQFEKTVLLENVDKFWREHIDAMAELQKGIGLRGYAQKDPVQEYKKEGMDMFNEMTSLIKKTTVEQLILIDFKFEKVEKQ